MKTYTRKTWNEKSSVFATVRERLSPAESSLQGRICEVHSGVGLVKVIIAGSVWYTLQTFE